MWLNLKKDEGLYYTALEARKRAGSL